MGDKEEESLVVVLKVDMHCEGCALKIKKSVKRFKGVEGARVNKDDGQLTVIGKVDPWMLRDYLEAKSQKKVEIISPVNPQRKEADGGATPSAAAVTASGDSKDQKKLTELAAPTSTVVLKVRLDCEGCIKRVKKIILKVKGVQEVGVDAKKGLMTVKGTIDINSVPSYIKNKLRRSVEIVTIKTSVSTASIGGGDKNNKAEDEKTKEKEGSSRSEKKEVGGAMEKKKERGGIGSGGGEKKEEGDSGEKNKEKKGVGGSGGEKKQEGGAGEKVDRGGGAEKKVEGSAGGEEREGGGDTKEKEKRGDDGWKGKEKEGGGGSEKKEEGGTSGWKNWEEGSGSGWKKEEGGASGEKKKEKEGEGSVEKKEKGGTSGEKKDKNGNGGEGGVKQEEAAVEMNKMEYYGPYEHMVEMEPYHLFSDDNPNACCII